MKKIFISVSFLIFFVVAVNAQYFKNIKLNMSGTISNGMVLRYDVITDTWYPTATIPSGSASYIWTSTTVQSGANFWISGNGKANILRAVSNSGTQGGTGGFNWAAANDSLYWTARITGVPTGTQGGYGLQFTAYGANVSQSNPLTLSRNGDVTFEGANLFLTNSTSNLINFPTAGSSAPTFTTRSAGTRILLYPSLSGSVTDYAMGVESGAMWLGTPVASNDIKFYAGTTTFARFYGTGDAGFTGSVGAGTLTPSNRLHVVGAPRIQNGFMSAGRVLYDTTGTGVGAWLEMGRPEPQVVATNSFTLNSTYRRYHFTAADNVAVTLPNSPSGRTYVIKKLSTETFNLTVTPASGNIDGNSSVVATSQNACLTFYTDGTNWFQEQ